MEYNLKKRNTPIATLIKNYINKKSGKVVDSREEILWRFDFLDWKDQKKIILAFLDSGKTDRQWAYAKVLDYWDKAFETKIMELWERFHEERCSWVVIRFFPVEYLVRNIDKFYGKRNYYFICLRLAADKDFVIDKDKLSLTDYLAVLYHTGRSIDLDEAKDILYKIVHKICVEGLSIFEKQLDRFADREKGAVISPANFQHVSLAMYYLKKLDCGQVVSVFEDWNRKIATTISGSPEYKAICNFDLSTFEYSERAICVARKYAYLDLDDKYKKPSDPDIEDMLNPQEGFAYQGTFRWDDSGTDSQKSADSAVLKEMIIENPIVEQLIGNLDLDVGENGLPS